MAGRKNKTWRWRRSITIDYDSTYSYQRNGYLVGRIQSHFKSFLRVFVCLSFLRRFKNKISRLLGTFSPAVCKVLYAILKKKAVCLMAKPVMYRLLHVVIVRTSTTFQSVLERSEKAEIKRLSVSRTSLFSCQRLLSVCAAV